MTEKPLQKKMQNYTFCSKTALTALTAAYLHSPIYTPSRPSYEVCAHVDLRQIVSTARRGYHISFPETVGSTEGEEGHQYHWAG